MFLELRHDVFQGCGSVEHRAGVGDVVERVELLLHSIFPHLPVRVVEVRPLLLFGRQIVLKAHR